MLTRLALDKAMDLTTILDNERVVLEPIPGTPLAELVKNTRSGDEFNSQCPNTNEYNPSVFDIEYIANAVDQSTGVCPHNECMNDFSQKIGDSLRNHIVYAKNVVAPVVEDLVEGVVKNLNDSAPSELLGMEVISWNPPKPMLNSSVEKSIMKFSDVPYDTPSLGMKLPNLTVSEIVELMKTGSLDVDNSIAEWVATKGDNFIINLWENMFQIKQAELEDTKSVTFDTYVNSSNTESVDNALAVYLISRRLADQPLPDTEMSLSLFNTLIVDFRNQAARYLSTVYEDINKINKSGRLIKNITGKVITVYDQVYRKWIEEGGDNDILFGNLLNKYPEIFVESINNNADVYKANWAKHAALIGVVERNKLFSRTKEVLSANFRRIINELTENQVGVDFQKEEALKLFGNALDVVTENDISDIWKLSLHLICVSLFNKTDAEIILGGIDRIKKENPNISVREAAGANMIEYISNWVASQFKPIIIS